MTDRQTDRPSEKNDLYKPLAGAYKIISIDQTVLWRDKNKHLISDGFVVNKDRKTTIELVSKLNGPTMKKYEENHIDYK